MTEQQTNPNNQQQTPPQNATPPSQFNPEDPAVQEWFKTATKGLVDNKEAILREKKDLEGQVKSMKEQWGDLDPEVVRNLMKRMQNDEETRLIAEGKVDEVITRKTDAFKRDHEAKLAAAQKKFEEAENALKERNQKIADLTIGTMVRQVAAESGIVPSAIEDVISRVKGVFTLDEDYNPIARNSDGTLMVGKDAKSPLSISEWLESVRDKTPHWYQGSSGGGTYTADGKPAGRITITKAESKNHQLYMSRLKEAQKLGVPLHVVDG